MHQKNLISKFHNLGKFLFKIFLVRQANIAKTKKFNTPANCKSLLVNHFNLTAFNNNNNKETKTVIR